MKVERGGWLSPAPQKTTVAVDVQMVLEVVGNAYRYFFVKVHHV